MGSRFRNRAGIRCWRCWFGIKQLSDYRGCDPDCCWWRSCLDRRKYHNRLPYCFVTNTSSLDCRRHPGLFRVRRKFNVLLLWCISLCNAGVGVGGAGIVQQGLSTDSSNPFGDNAGSIDCASAKAALTEVKQALANAEKERDEKQRELNDAVGNANTARNLMITAVAALAVAPFCNLAAIAVALVAVGMTTSIWLYRQALVATASAALAAAQALVNALEGAVAVAQAAKDVACGSSADVSVPVDSSMDVGTKAPSSFDLGTQ